MHHRRPVLSFVLLLGLAALVSVSSPVAAEPTEGVRTMRGSFQWDQGGTGGDLEAHFTPTGEGTWDVSFHFEFRGEPHAYTGTATGSLAGGTLQGVVANENKKRTWTFEGTVEDGTFKGKHVETTEGRENTGTLRLAAD